MNLRWILLPLALAACQKPAADTGPPPLAGARIGGPFSLTDQDGRTVTDRSFAGKYRLMYFGYTFCPDVCPTDMAAIAAGLKQVAADAPATAAKVVPIFVTVDPERDTPAVLKQFTAAFSPHPVGLTGSPAAIDAVKKAYGVYAAKGAATPGGGYMVDHSRQAYLMGPDNRPVALVPQDQGPKAVAATVEQWVK
ncbi:SCO family protein [Sphingomonas sp. KR1UV-12]|uniref:SCO family protein n=1 Tax=Sphingomonas aurea TaxID=3063994 RepID=A0ABT9ELJ2_9SPHN|nr:SCO family protein [Sphingomonas sp. KR1UV-12]MDP1027843.1 SCO family protein [Sphingomonas sp. KR1UV-12]